MKPVRLLYFLTAVLLLALCVSCENGAPASETEKPDDRALELDLTGFVIMRSDTGSKEEVGVAVLLRKDIEERCGLQLELQTDWVMRGEEVPADTAEIVVGNTTRRKDETLRLADWSITREGNRVYIIGGGEGSLAEAERYFAEKFLVPGGLSMPDGFAERHEAEYPIQALSIAGVPLTDIRICSNEENNGGKTARLADLLGTRTGMRAAIVGTAARANVIVTNTQGHGIENGCWGISVEDGKIYVIGRTKVETRKAFAYLFSLLEATSGTLDFSNESGKPYMHSEKQMTEEEFRLQKQLVIYPEYPAMINRSYDYSVSVTMDKDTRSLPVYDHVMQNSIRNRALNGDLHRRFCQFSFSGGQVRVDIKVRSSFSSYSVAPSAKAFRNEFKDGVISVWLDKPDYFFVMLDDDLNSMVSIFADYPEFPDELPEKDDPNVLWIDGVYETDGGVLSILDKVNYTIYIAPGAVLNCRVRLKGANNSIIGRGALVDPYEDIRNYHINNNSDLHRFIAIDGSNTLLDGFVMLDARCFNILISGGSNVTRNVKILSAMMTSDGITHYSSNSLVEHCFIYNGDNSIVIGGVKNVTVSDVVIGTTCSAVFPQGSAQGWTLNDIYVFRVGEAIVNCAYNPDENDYEMDFTFNNLDLTDITFLPYYFNGQKMGVGEKHFVFNGTNAPTPIGAQDPHTAVSSRPAGTHYFFTFYPGDAKKPCYNFVLDFNNLYLDGAPVTSAGQLDNTHRQNNNPMTFTNDGMYTPLKKNSRTVNYTAPDAVFAGSRQLFFRSEVKVTDSAWLLPADEIKTYLRKPDASIKTDLYGGTEYVRSTDLIASGMAKEVKLTDAGLVITPAYSGENLLLPDEGEISRFIERVCYQVDLNEYRDDDGIYYTLSKIKTATAGTTRFVTDDVKMYGAGRYRLTFKACSEESGRVSAGYTTETTEKYQNWTLSSAWEEHAFEFTLTDKDVAGAVAIWFAPQVTPFVTTFDIRDITLVKAD